MFMKQHESAVVFQLLLELLFTSSLLDCQYEFETVFET